MDAAKPPTALRWVVALILPLLCALLVTLLLSAPPGTQPFGMRETAVVVETLCLITMGLAIYAWLVYPPAGGLLISAVVLICLLWAWALRKASGLDLAAFGILVGAAVWQQRRRPRQFLRMQQVIGDLNEERTVKDQAMAAAIHTREALQKKHSRYAQLQTIAEALSKMADLAAIARLAVESAFRLIGKSEVCLLFLVDQERQELSLYASEKRESIKAIRAKHGDQFDRYVLRTHSPLLVNDVRRDFRFTVTVSPERDVSSVIACPLLLGQSPGGVLRLDSSQPGAYTQDDLRFLDILLNLAGTAVTNAKLFAQTQQLAMTDGLTGLMLRRPFLEQLTRELIRSGRSREPVSVLMLDVDQFKRYNDTFGHTAGDLILKGVAEVLREAVPAGGLIARYGGEEFVVLLPRWPRPAAQGIAENIRRRVEERIVGSARGGRHFVMSGQVSEQRTPPPTAPPKADIGPFPRPSASGSSPRDPEQGRGTGPVPGGGVTVSLGVASFPDDAQADVELLRVADQRLYQAKRDGRNRVCSS